MDTHRDLSLGGRDRRLSAATLLGESEDVS